ncbi:MAG: MAPEG family protein [Pseudomonadota bacterium]
MLTWILLGLVVYTLGLFLPSFFTVSEMGLGGYLGSRDDEPDAQAMHGRAARAHRNFSESLAPFLALGILAMVVEGADQSLALLGAQLFVVARIAYIPLYMLAVPVVRSGAWIAGFVGMIMMAYALL